MLFRQPRLLFALTIAIVLSMQCSVYGDLVIVFRGSHNGSVAELTNGANGSETFNLDATSGPGTTAATYTYTIDNIDAAADGTANDSLTATFAVSSASGNVQFQTDGNFGVTGNGAGNLNDVSESITYTLGSTSVTLGDGGTGSVTGGGYNQIQFSVLSSATEVAVLTGTSADGNVTGTTTFDPVSTFTVGHNDDGASFRVGPARYRFVITTVAVPEPMSAQLLLLVAGAAFARRRR